MSRAIDAREPVGLPSSTKPLEAEALVKRYGRQTALVGIDVSVERGQITALIGPNGAGKSTLIRSWAGFERPTHGRVRVLGADPWRSRGSVVRRIGYVSQSPRLYDQLTVADHIDLACRLRPGFDAAYANTRLADLRVPLNARGVRLSGGQKAQVVLSIALGTRAEILLLDEPVASLDPLARREFLAVVRSSASAEGTTVLMASHVVTDVEQACDSIIVLGAGRVLAEGSIAGLLGDHFVTDVHDVAGPIVGSFLDNDSRTITVMRGQTQERAPSSRPATLEEIVLAHLAGVRSMEAIA